MRQNSERIEGLYGSIAGEWTEAFSDEHEKKPKDRVILFRFSQEVVRRMPVWELSKLKKRTSNLIKGRTSNMVVPG